MLMEINVKKIKIIDPIECNVPNVCFSLMKKDDKRWNKMKKERLKYGFDESETWSLYNTLSEFLLPRLKRYSEIAPTVIVIDDNMKKAIEDMIWLLTRINEEEQNSEFISSEEYKKFPDIFKRFGEHFMGLWW